MYHMRWSTALICFILASINIYRVNGMVRLDLCASFTHEYEDSSIELVTPGYVEGTGYSNNSYCYCDIQTIQPTGRDKTLNITVLDLKIENCSDTRTAYDTLNIRTTYSFQALYQDFTLCGSKLPLSSTHNLRTPGGQLYGEDNTLFSLETMRLTFSTDENIEKKGARLLVSSNRGIRVACAGVSGPLPTEPPTTTPDPSLTTTLDTSDRWGEEREANKRKSLITGTVIGVLLALLAIGAAIGAFILIRKHRGRGVPKIRHNKNRTPQSQLPPSSNGRSDIENNHRQQSDGRHTTIYKDPNQGMPELPIHASVKEPNTRPVQCTDEYLYMKGGNSEAHTPIYANPQIGTAEDQQASYVNEGLNGGQQEDEYQPGYIIPGLERNGHSSGSTEEGVPLMKGLVMTENRPQFTKKEPLPMPRLQLQKTTSAGSCDSDQPLLYENPYDNNSPMLDDRKKPLTPPVKAKPPSPPPPQNKPMSPPVRSADTKAPLPTVPKSKPLMPPTNKKPVTNDTVTKPNLDKKDGAVYEPALTKPSDFLKKLRKVESLNIGESKPSPAPKPKLTFATSQPLPKPAVKAKPSNPLSGKPKGGLPPPPPPASNKPGKVPRPITTPTEEVYQPVGIQTSR